MIITLFDNRFDAEWYLVAFQSEMPSDYDVREAEIMSYVYMVDWED